MKNTLNGIFKEAEYNYNIIFDTYKILEKCSNLKIQIHSAGQWILDNMYIIEEAYEDVKYSKSSLKNKRLPIVKTHDGDKYISIFYLAYELVEMNTGYIDQNIIYDCLKEHQKLSYLTSEELNLFMLMLKLALLKFISRIAQNITNSQMKKIQVEDIISGEYEDSNIAKELYREFKDFRNFREYMLDTTKIKNTNTAFVEYMAYRLKELGTKGEKYFETLKIEAEKIGFTIDEAIVKEHMEVAKTTDYIGRAILSYKQLQGINFREIFERVNKVDEALKDDYTNEFRKCDYKTKTRYRNYIIKLAKKYNFSEVYVARKAVECSIKYKKHVGFFLIGEDRYLLKKELGKPHLLNIIENKFVNKVKSLMYVVSILILSLEFTLITTAYVIPFYENWKIIVSMILMFIFYMEIFEKIINYAIRKSMIPEILPRFDFAKTIDPKFPTYVVIPTIITSIEKLDTMIKKMEITYLANRTENMYYMLLGDCMSSDKEILDIDSKIIRYAKERLDELNKKYESKHILFNFMYRKRVYSKTENCYMGWERKRGALLQFNKIVLGEIKDEDINKIATLIYHDIVNAKYAITIDEDTQLSLNTAKDLVSIISHPLNQPVIDEKRGIVKKGYGLIQPSVGLDIEAANKSIFSKIFGGFGGLDIYTTAVSNVYHDVFGEAIFCGKGIYDIKLFEDLVSKEIPENLVLSHDLLEGSIIRAGLASDIELQDGFPNSYIAYMKRNHRWYRGDMQIIKWLLSPKSKLTLLSKWKIFDNIRRPMLDVFVLIAIILSLFISAKCFFAVVVTTFCVLNFGSIISILDTILFGRVRHTKELQYIPIIHGIQADLLTMCFNFITVPYTSYICVSAFLTSIYRMFISKKHLLQWTTAEVLEKKTKDSIFYYYFNMISNVIIGIFILLMPTNYTVVNMHAYVQFKDFIALSFIVAPIIAYLLGKDHLLNRKERLDKKQEDEVIEVAKRTWLFFDTVMSPINNYLPTDNFQENRRYKLANRTSSTNIGFGILSIINAYDLKFITEEEAIHKLINIFGTIEKLEKWNGHLYNWYNIKTLEPLRPRFISTVDSGNFVACLYVAKQFLISLKDTAIYNQREFEEYDKNIDILIKNIENLIENTNFKVLYDTTRNLFSIGYAQETGKLLDSYYDMLMSESRTTSLIAIASRQITSKHWFALSRNLVKVDGYKGVMSWSGTAFEYFMPYIFNKSYPHTLIDQSLFFTKYSQMKYGKDNNVPWGISESAFAVMDNELNYQYKEFGIPWLGLKRGLNNYMVISPYSSLLMIEFAPQDVYKNIQRLKKIGAYSSYGFYEAIDFTKDHISPNSKFELVKTYMAHHQGMILSSINNYINNGIIKERFHSNPDIKACELILKEREKIIAKINKKTSDEQNKFKQKSTEKYTTYVTGSCSQRKDESEVIAFNDEFNIALLKGSNLSTIITNNGASYLKYKDKIINKQRYTDVMTSGNYLYITDKTNGKTINVTNTDIYSNNNLHVKKTIWNSTLNSVESYIEDENLETTTTVFLSPEFNMEIKKVSVYNNSNERREILINTYIEPAMTDFMTNVVHPSFSNLQIETYYDNELDVLVASKRKKGEDDTEFYVYSKLIGIDLEKEMETEKNKIINFPSEAYDSNIVKYPLWPVLSYRATIILDPHERQEFYYVLGVADSRYKISTGIINLDIKGITNQYKLSNELNNVVSRYLKLEPGRANIYNNIIKEVLFKKVKLDNEKYWDSSINQSLLWKYSISGDLPIILVYVNKIENAGIVNETINFMDYVKNRKLDIDIVILIDEEEKEFGPIYKYIRERLDRAVYMDYSRGNIYLLNINNLNKNEIDLLSFISKKYIQDVSEFLCNDTEVTKHNQIDFSNNEEEEASYEGN